MGTEGVDKFLAFCGSQRVTIPLDLIVGQINAFCMFTQFLFVIRFNSAIAIHV